MSLINTGASVMCSNVASVAASGEELIEYIDGFPVPAHRYKAEHLSQTAGMDGVYSDTLWIMQQLAKAPFNRRQLALEYSVRYTDTSRRLANRWLRETVEGLMA